MMNKNDIIEALAEEHELTRGFARDMVDGIFEMISDAAKRGEEVSIFGFGKFKVADRKARKGRNPQTGEPVKIAASRNLKFEQAKAVKEMLNTKRGSRKKG
jgi:DNA-binding protein HU-beta